MKKISSFMLAAMMLLCSGCNTGLLSGLGGLGGDDGTGSGGTLGSVLGGILGVLGSQNTVDGLLGLVIGSVAIQESELYGAWCYTQPGCAFTSENLLAKAGGAVAAETCKDKLLPVYNTLGISSQNTQFQFTQDHQFQAYVKGIPISGTYTYDQQNATIKLKTMLFSQLTEYSRYLMNTKHLKKVII